MFRQQVRYVPDTISVGFPNRVFVDFDFVGNLLQLFLLELLFVTSCFLPVQTPNCHVHARSRNRGWFFALVDAVPLEVLGDFKGSLADIRVQVHISSVPDDVFRHDPRFCNVEICVVLLKLLNTGIYFLL